jgi:uncharacterized protein YbbK (DUF523 family)
MEQDNRTVLVSSCLLGLETRYDATDNYSQEVADYIEKSDLIPIPICPEQLAGLSTPRSKCWFASGDGAAALKGTGRLINEEGLEMTNCFIKGAEKALEIARMTGCTKAILQQRSPSCGTQKVYINQQLTEGIGITAALFRAEGIEIIGDDELARSETPDQSPKKS